METDGKKVPPAPFHIVMKAAETVRLDPASTSAQFDDQRKIIHKVNEQA